MTRIWHQSVNELEHLNAYGTALRTHAAGVLQADVTVEVHGLATGTYGGISPTAALGNAVTYLRCLAQVVDLAIQAERGGYDAFVIGSFSEPFLREIRTAVDIPVVSMTEAALLTSFSLGRKAALISNAPNVQWMAASSVRKHGFGERVLDVVSLDPAVDEFELEAAFDDPRPLLDNFTTTSRQLIARGADVIVPAEGVMARVLSAARLTRIDRTPILDVFAIAWAQAAMLANLWRTTGLRVGRQWEYSRGSAP